jgi:hypothetical protein
MNASQRAALAYKTVRSDLGRRAADEGWLNELWDYVFRYGELPSGADITAMQEAARVKWQDLPSWPFECARQAVIRKFEKLRKMANEHRTDDA